MFGVGPFAGPSGTIPRGAIVEFDEIVEDAPYYLCLGNGVAASYDIYFREYDIKGFDLVLTERYLSPRGTHFGGKGGLIFPGVYANYWLKRTDVWSRPMPTAYDSGIRTVDAVSVSARDVATVFAKQGMAIEDYYAKGEAP
jgi:hypothetical protein